MAEPGYALKPLDPSRLDDWLGFVDGNLDARRRLLMAQMSEQPEICRYLVSDRDGSIAARVTVEKTQLGLTTWCPTIRRGVGSDAVPAALNAAARDLANMAGTQARFVECTLRGEDPMEPAWKQAMLGCGFRLVATKRLWSAAVADSMPISLQPDLSIAHQTTNTPEFERLFTDTQRGTLDRCDALEAAYGVAINEFDWIMSAHLKDQLVGLAVCLLGEDPDTAWIKYVGVLPEWTGRGIASQLLQATMTDLRGRKVETALAIIDDENLPSIALHQRFGFCPDAAPAESFYAEAGSSVAR